MRKAILALVVGLCGWAGMLQAQTRTEGETRATPATATRSEGCAQGRGCVTGLPLPRFVSLKGTDGKARRGPASNHRIDWVFTRAGMPLRITAEYEHWRRVEDHEGAGGWMHYSLLSGSRSVLVVEDLAELRNTPEPGSTLIARVETGVVARVSECRVDWCRIRAEGVRGWVPKSALWGVDTAETFD